MKFEINTGVRVHFIGIGGIGMSGIAEVLLSHGFKVTGSDINESKNTEKLEKLGAKICLEHNEDNITDQGVVVYSSAIKQTNVELKKAVKLNIPIMQRAEMVAELMRLKCGLAVAGTHGKTTTSGMLATILTECNFDPTYLIGGIVQNLKGHAKVGNGDYIIVEADESDGSFLLYNPVMSIINNIDLDHMDYYGTAETLNSAFEKFANRVPFFGLCALNAHDPNLMKLRDIMKKPSVTYGIGDELSSICDFEAREVTYNTAGIIFDLYFKGDRVGKVKLNAYGRYNLLNSLGAIAVAKHLKLSFEEIIIGLEKFSGIKRRFNFLYKSKKLIIIDDYAHHPTAISSVLRATRVIYPNAKIITLFEPHRYTRTRDCWNQFFHSFNYSDELFIGPIYSASERPIHGISSEALSEDINKLHPNFSSYIADMEELPTKLKLLEHEEVVLIALGAGSIGKKIHKIVESIKEINE